MICVDFSLESVPRACKTPLQTCFRGPVAAPCPLHVLSLPPRDKPKAGLDTCGFLFPARYSKEIFVS